MYGLILTEPDRLNTFDYKLVSIICDTVYTMYPSVRLKIYCR